MFTLSLSRLSKIATSRAAAASLAIALGFALVLITGFAPMDEVHNAAHDTRHTAAFPCH